MALSKQVHGPYSDFFICGICNKLAVRPQVHDGGYGQDFCQRTFCEICVGMRADNPIHRRPGKYGGFETICPTNGCKINFKPPYFRKLGVIEKICYNKLTITCLVCERRLEIYNFMSHKASCRGRDSNSGVSPVWYGDVNRFVSAPANQSIIKTIINNEKLRIVSNNMVRWKKENVKNLIDMYFRTLGSDFQFTMPTDISSLEALRRLAVLKNFDERSIDVVYFCHVSLRQFEKFSDFLNLMPSCSDFNLVGWSKNFPDPSMDLRLHLVAAHPKRIVAEDITDDANQAEA